MRRNKKLNYGILVGTFDEDQLKRGVDEQAIERMQEKYPNHKYINSIETKKDGKRALRVYICELKDLQMRF